MKNYLRHQTNNKLIATNQPHHILHATFYTPHKKETLSKHRERSQPAFSYQQSPLPQDCSSERSNVTRTSSAPVGGGSNNTKSPASHSSSKRSLSMSWSARPFVGTFLGTLPEPPPPTTDPPPVLPLLPGSVSIASGVGAGNPSACVVVPPSPGAAEFIATPSLPLHTLPPPPAWRNLSCRSSVNTLRSSGLDLRARMRS